MKTIDELLQIEKLIQDNNYELELIIHNVNSEITIFSYNEVIFHLHKLPCRILLDKTLEFLTNE